MTRLAVWARRCAAALAAYFAVLAALFGLAQAVPSPDGGPPPAAVIVFYDDTDSMRIARVKTAAGRVLANGGARLVATGGWRPARNYNGAARMAAEAEALGVPRARIAHDAGSNDSVSNLSSAASLLGDTGRGPVEFVSDRYHLLRLGLMAGRSMNGRAVRLVPASADTGGFDMLRRLNHELFAYAALLLPRSWLEAILARLRAR